MYSYVTHICQQIILIFSSGTSKLTERQKVNMKTYLYCYHTDTFLNITNILRDQFVEFQQDEPL